MEPLSVRELLEFIKLNNIPPSAKVVYEHIEDFYFEENGWETEDYPDYLLNWVPKFEDENVKCIDAYNIFYDEEKDVLIITAHY